jgi:ABC-type sugar transport system substrate-binding protein
MSLAVIIEGITRFVKKRKILSIGIAAAVVVVVVLLAGGVIGPGSTLGQEDAPSQEEIDAYYEGADEDTMAGLSGESEATPTPYGDFAEKGHIIGISVLAPNIEDYQLLAYVSKAADASIEAGEIDNILYRDANGDDNQQLQDVLTMINDGANTIVVMGTDNYNFQKISELCNENYVKIVACNIDATEGFDVNIVSQANYAKTFADFAAQSGAPFVYTIDATETEVNTIREIVPVNANIEGADATANLSDRLDRGEEVWDMMFFDNSANAVLKTYIGKGVVPNSIATPAYVGFIRTWYDLMHDGVSIETTDEEGNVISSTEPMTATPEEFHAIAYTQVQNLGEIVYKFAYNISVGKVLPEDNYVYAVADQEYVTNENIDAYYAQIGDLEDTDILPAVADTAEIDELFS